MDNNQKFSDVLDGLPIDEPKIERKRAKAWMETAALHMTNEIFWRKCARALWCLLDDISTLDDMCHSDDAVFRKLASDIYGVRSHIFDVDDEAVDEGRELLEEKANYKDILSEE